MALNFDLLQPANIGANFMAGRKEAQDMETGRLQQQEARMKLDDFQRKQAGLDKFLAAAKQRGRDGDPVDVANDYYEWAVSQRNPELITQAMTLAQTAAQRKKFNAMQNPNQLAGVTRPVAPAGELGSGTFDPNAPAPTNALAPMAAPSVMTPSNALAPKAAAPAAPVAPVQVDRIAQIENRLAFLNQFRELPEAKVEAERLVKEYDRLTTPHVVGGSLVTGAGKSLFTAPAALTDIAKLIKERDALPPGDPSRAIYDKEISDRGAANRNAQQRLAFDQQKFNWEKANPGYELKEDANGGVVGVNKRTLESFPVMVGGAAAPVAGAAAAVPAAPSVTVDGRSFPGPRTETPAIVGPRTQLMGKTPAMTETQSNAATFGGAMMQAQNTIDQLEKTGTVKNAVVPGLLTGLAKLVPLGVGENLGNVIQSTFNADPTGLIGPNADQQKLAQAQLSFSIAYLRKTSGAAFGATEVSNTIQEYFPVIGDSEKVIAQKTAARKRAIDGMRISTNAEGKKYIDSFKGGENAPVGSNLNDPLNLGVR